MNERGDISPTLQHWLADGPTRMPDRVVNVVADRIAREPQRRGWRLRWRRRPKVNAGLAVAVGGRTVGRRAGRSSRNRWFAAVQSAAPNSTSHRTGFLCHAESITANRRDASGGCRARPHPAGGRQPEDAERAPVHRAGQAGASVPAGLRRPSAGCRLAARWTASRIRRPAGWPPGSMDGPVRDAAGWNVSHVAVDRL